MLHDQATARTLGFARICIFGLCAVNAIARPVWEVAYFPDFQAVGVLRWVGAELWVPLLSPSVLVALQVLTVALCLAVAAGVGPFLYLSLAACSAMTVSEGLLCGLGGIAHRAQLPLLMAYVLCFFPAADALTLTPQRQQRPVDRATYQAALVAASLVFTLTYSLVGVRRMIVGGWEIYLDDTILILTAWRDAVLGSDGGFGQWACQSVVVAWMLRIGFPLVTLMELLSPLLLFSRRFRWFWLAVMFPFHIGTGFLMAIWFPYNLLLMPILAGFDPFRRARESREARVGGPRLQRAA